MTPELRTRWADALVSGQYTQGQKVLRDADNCYCCLGVLTDLYLQDHPEAKGWELTPTDDGPGRFFCDGTSVTLPDVVRDWAGTVTSNPDVYDTDSETGEDHVHSMLSTLNDKGATFAEIAAFIRDGDVR
jgi:hypothetical protein